MERNSSISGVLEGVRSSAITVHQARCASVRNRNAGCRKCAEACTSGCIRMDEEHLVIDASKCVGCGTCATVCPTCALESRNPSDAQLLEQCCRASVDGRTTIMCRPCQDALSGLVDGARVARVVCLGRVDESLIASLAAGGINDIHMVHGRCEACDQGTGLDCAQVVAENARCLLKAWGSSARVSVTDDPPSSVWAQQATSPHIRAALTSYFSRQRGNEPIGKAFSSHAPDTAEAMLDGASPKVLKVMNDGTLPHFVPDRREKLLDALAHIGQPVCESVATRLWGCVVIDGTKCTSCRMCATFCPTGALARFDDPDGSFGIEHYPGDCVKCGTCRSICPEQAIVLLDTVKIPCVVDGTVHRYKMQPRSVQMNDEHQIVNTMRAYIDGDIFER